MGAIPGDLDLRVFLNPQLQPTTPGSTGYHPRKYHPRNIRVMVNFRRTHGCQFSKRKFVHPKNMKTRPQLISRIIGTSLRHIEVILCILCLLSCFHCVVLKYSCNEFESCNSTCCYSASSLRVPLLIYICIFFEFIVDPFPSRLSTLWRTLGRKIQHHAIQCIVFSSCGHHQKSKWLSDHLSPASINLVLVNAGQRNTSMCLISAPKSCDYHPYKMLLLHEVLVWSFSGE